MINGQTAQATLYFESEMDGAEMHTFSRRAVGVFSVRALGKATVNEDAAGLISCDQESGVIVVADGLGGNAGGELASATAIREIHRSIQDAASGQMMLRTAILNGIENANLAVQRLGVGAATTLALVEISNDEVRPYHVGDSVILLVGGLGKLKMFTIPHSPVGYGVESGLLDDADAMHHEERHIVSNYVGSPEMRIEMGPSIRLAPRDTLVVASDGLFDNLYPAEIIELIRKGPLPKVMEKLRAEVWTRMTHPEVGRPSKFDDLTFVIMRGRKKKVKPVPPKVIADESAIPVTSLH